MFFGKKKKIKTNAQWNCTNHMKLPAILHAFFAYNVNIIKLKIENELIGV